MNGCLLWSMATVYNEHGGYLRWAWRLFVMSLVVVCDGTHAIIKKEK